MERMRPRDSNERTALIQVVHVGPPRQPHSNSVLRRIFSVALGSLVAIAVILFLLPEALWSKRHDGDGRKLGLTYEELQTMLLSTPDEHRIRDWSSYYTSGPHLAGKNLSQVLWTQSLWRDFGISQATIVDYEVYLNYPSEHWLELWEKSVAGARRLGDQGEEEQADVTAGEWNIVYAASLEEDVLKEDDTTNLTDRIPTFHGYSANGLAAAPYVYANYGTYRDFDDLTKANISLDGKIALVKYGHVFRGLKVKRAEELGMLGVVMYSDPGDDGDITLEHGFQPYPRGPARQPSSVQRGSVQDISKSPDANISSSPVVDQTGVPRSGMV